MRTVSMVALAAVASPAMDCGPKPHEVGLAVLLATPLIFLITALGTVGLLRLWRQFRPEVWPAEGWPPGWRALGLVLAGECVVSMLALADGRGDKMFTAALVLHGTTYAAAVLVFLRLFIALVPRRALLYAHLPPMAFFLPTAALLALGGADPPGWLNDHCVDVMGLLGFVGWTPGGLLALLLGELGVRAWRRKKVVGARRLS